jgi:hypothetical protein
MRRVIPITEQFQYFVTESSFWEAIHGRTRLLGPKFLEKESAREGNSIWTSKTTRSKTMIVKRQGQELLSCPL